MIRSTWLCLVVLAGFARAQPAAPPGSTVNAADYTRRIAPGAYITIFGADLAPGFAVAGFLPLPAQLLGTSIEVSDGVRVAPIPLWFVSPGQVSGQLFYDLAPAIRARVRTPDGVTEWDSLTLVERAPAAYAMNEQGAGRAMLVHPDGRIVTRQSPLHPGQWATAYVNSLGAVEPPVPAGYAAGDGSPGNPLSVVTGEVTVSIDNLNTEVGWSGLAPYYPGLYQVNLFTPYYNVIGDLVFRVGVDGVISGQPISVPVEPNGFYYVNGAGKFPNGQRKTAVPGPGAAVVFRHEIREIWGADGFREWTFNSHLGPEHAATSGLALTLKHGGRIVYDNNGIDSGADGGFYDNRNTGVSDNDWPGLFEWYSMSNDLFAMFAGYFRLDEPTEIDQIIGYFDGDGLSQLPFDPNNNYNRYRVNIYSNGPGDKPAANGFIGDVFSSDTAAGAFEVEGTAIRRTFSGGASDPIYRLVYTLEQPITLEPGEYWFSHDCAVPELPDGGNQALSGLPKRGAGTAHRPLPPGQSLAGR